MAIGRHIHFVSEEQWVKAKRLQLYFWGASHSIARILLVQQVEKDAATNAISMLKIFWDCMIPVRQPLWGWQQQKDRLEEKRQPPRFSLVILLIVDINKPCVCTRFTRSWRLWRAKPWNQPCSAKLNMAELEKEMLLRHCYGSVGFQKNPRLLAL